MVTSENVFYCTQGDSPVALVSTSDKEKCPDCGKDMSQIGWFEGDERIKTEDDQEGSDGVTSPELRMVGKQTKEPTPNGGDTK